MNFIDVSIKHFYLKLGLENLSNPKMEHYGKMNFKFAYKYFLKVSKNEPEKFGYQNFIDLVKNRLNEKKKNEKDLKKFVFILVNKKKQILLFRNFELKQEYDFFHFFGNTKKGGILQIKKQMFLNFGISIKSRKFENVFGFLKKKKIYLKNTVIYNFEEKEIFNKTLFRNLFYDNKLKWKNLNDNNLSKNKYKEIQCYLPYIKNYFLEKFSNLKNQKKNYFLIEKKRNNQSGKKLIKNKKNYFFDENKTKFKQEKIQNKKNLFLNEFKKKMEFDFTKIRKKTAETEVETENAKNDIFVNEKVMKLDEDLNLFLKNYQF